jgi:hypothetical protein
VCGIGGLTKEPSVSTGVPLIPAVHFHWFRSAAGFSGMKSFENTVEARRAVLGSNYPCGSEMRDMADEPKRRDEERIAKMLDAEHKESSGVFPLDWVTAPLHTGDG